jgi:rhamnulokinase
MPAAIQQFCRNSGQPVPETEGELIRCVLESLALTYASTIQAVEEVTGAKIEVIHVVGGGSRNQVLNSFTANACGLPVVAGPVEATVLGNVLVQARSNGEIRTLSDIRSVVHDSSDVVRLEPDNAAAWQDARGRFDAVCH